MAKVERSITGSWAWLRSYNYTTPIFLLVSHLTNRRKIISIHFPRFDIFVHNSYFACENRSIGNGVSNLSNLQPIKVELSGTYRPDNRVHQNENSSVQIFFNRMDFKGAFRDSTFPSRRSQLPPILLPTDYYVRSIGPSSFDARSRNWERGEESRKKKKKKENIGGRSVAKRVLRRASYFYIIEDRLARV